eukprot:scaffold3617_cov119-Isochrysis_galbana.AAC.10
MASAPRPTGDAQAAVAAIGGVRALEAPPIRGLSGCGRRAASAAGITACRGCGSPFRSLEEEALGACRVAWTCSVGSGGASQVRWCLWHRAAALKSVESKVVHEVNKPRRDEPAACTVANISLTTG